NLSRDLGLQVTLSSTRYCYECRKISGRSEKITNLSDVRGAGPGIAGWKLRAESFQVNQLPRMDKEHYGPQICGPEGVKDCSRSESVHSPETERSAGKERIFSHRNLQQAPLDRFLTSYWEMRFLPRAAMIIDWKEPKPSLDSSW